MRLVFFSVLLLLTACQPNMGARSFTASGISGEGLMGTWYTDRDNEVVEVSYSQNRLRFAAFNGALTERSILFVNATSYYDYGVAEFVDFSVNGNQARVCYEIGCHTLRRNP